MAVYIRLNGFEQLAAIFGFDSNVSAFDWSSAGIRHNALKNRCRGPCACSKKNQPNKTDSKQFDKHKLTLRPKMGTREFELRLAQLNARAWTVLSHTRGPRRDSLLVAPITGQYRGAFAPFRGLTGRYPSGRSTLSGSARH